MVLSLYKSCFFGKKMKVKSGTLISIIFYSENNLSLVCSSARAAISISFSPGHCA